MAIKRDEFLKFLASLRKDEIVLTAWQASIPWETYSPSPFNFPSVRTMGETSTFGLGLAIARPDKRIIVLEGDGSLLMNLGSLVTISTVSPPNLTQVLLQNRMYETSGGQMLPNADKLDFAAFARAAGIPRAYHYDDMPRCRLELPRLLQEKGPVFIVVDMEPGADHASAKEFGWKIRAKDLEFVKRFRQALAENPKS
ncbi:MAG: thiamine pyrophosphate-binding protein [Chloroflexi bacterium]|nr:thiamine pyrophosphate-binding protein [Chloroflexota bacterium]